MSKKQIELPFHNHYVGEFFDTLKNQKRIVVLISPTEVRVTDMNYGDGIFTSVDHFLRLVKTGRFVRKD